MRVSALLCGVIGAIITLLSPGLASAQNSISWVASNGGGVACTRAAPCSTFASALAATVVEGEVHCVDSGDFGPLAITQNVVIDCTGTLATVSGGITVTGQVNILTLRGLVVDGFGQGTTGLAWRSGGELHIENCKFSGWSAATIGSNIAVAILIAPGASFNNVFITDTVVTDSGSGASGGGIVIQPSGSVSTRVAIDRVTVRHNNYGIFANGTATAFNPISLQIRDSVVSDNFFAGITAFTAASITVERTSSILNGTFGFWADGSGGNIILKNATAMSNVTGLNATSGGNIFSYQNNALNGNVTNAACAPAPCTLPPNVALTLN